MNSDPSERTEQEAASLAHALRTALQRRIIDQQQYEQILRLAEVSEHQTDGLQLSMVHLLWVSGTALVIAAMVLLAVELGGDKPSRLVAVCSIYAITLFLVRRHFTSSKRLRLLGSILLVGTAVSLTFALLGLQDLVGQASWFHETTSPPKWVTDGKEQYWIAYSPWLYSAVLPLLPIMILSLILLSRDKFLPAWPLVLISGAAIGWEFVVQLLRGPNALPDAYHETYILVVGATVYLLGWRADLTASQNHGFWLNKTGVLFLSLWMTIEFEDSELQIFLFGVALVLTSLYLYRPSGITVGAGTAYGYLSFLFEESSQDVLIALAVAIIGLGLILIGRKIRFFEDKLDKFLPLPLRRLRPSVRDDPITYGF